MNRSIFTTKPAEGSSWHTLTAKDMATLFQTTPECLGPEATATLASIDSRHRPIDLAEMEAYVLEFINRLQAPWIERSGEENHIAWTKGWSENLEEVRRLGASADTLKPKYFRGSPYLRFRKGVVVSPNCQIEHDLFRVTRQHLFQRYLSEASTICEIGCGSGQNLWMLTELFPEKKIMGLDWVTPCVEIAHEIAKIGRQVTGHLFDMTQPDGSFHLPQNTAVITIHALEQIGQRHKQLIEWLIAQKPQIVLQHEPVLDFYDPENTFDALALWYSKKRNYLEGYYEALLVEEKKGRLKIETAYRPELGGVLHEMSVLVWRPL
jgi:ubiquinone/menaquinone biosynthesis C-methylase UbiE